MEVYRYTDSTGSIVRTIEVDGDNVISKVLRCDWMKDVEGEIDIFPRDQWEQNKSDWVLDESYRVKQILNEYGITC